MTTTELGRTVDTDAAPQPSAPLDVLAIGAGQAGLSMAWHLDRRGVRYLLVDAAPEVEHSWRSRWDSLRLFSSARYDGLPGVDFPALPDSYPGKDQVADFLAAYAERHAFPILNDTEVTRLVPDDGGLTAHTTRGPVRGRQVVVATGAFQRPVVPSQAGSFTGVAQVHSSAYRRPADLPAGRVLVAGAAHSGSPRHDCGRSLAVPGLWLLGLPWQRTRGSALLGFVQRDAAHLDTQLFAHTPAR
jgi:putative flavoprotein involved in K+ transport